MIICLGTSKSSSLGGFDECQTYIYFLGFFLGNLIDCLAFIPKIEVTAVILIELCRQETKKRKEEETGSKCEENEEVEKHVCCHGRYWPILRPIPMVSVVVSVGFGPIPKGQKKHVSGHDRYRPIPADTQTDTRSNGPKPADTQTDTKGAKKHVVRTWPRLRDTSRSPDRYQEYRPETSRYPDRYSCAEIGYEAVSPLPHFRTFQN